MLRSPAKAGWATGAPLVGNGYSAAIEIDSAGELLAAGVALACDVGDDEALPVGVALGFALGDWLGRPDVCGVADGGGSGVVACPPPLHASKAAQASKAKKPARLICVLNVTRA